jgi:hypothetical protein
MADNIGVSPYHRDSLVNIWVTEDALQAFADFLPSFGDGEPLSIDYVHHVLRSEGVDYGIDETLISETVEHCNLDHEPVMQVCIAAGRPPVRTNPARMELVAEYQRALERHKQGHNNIPYAPSRGVGLGIVRQGTVIAVEREEFPGIDGVDVYNRPIPHGELEVPAWHAGPGIDEADSRWRAKHGGLLALAGDELFVEETIRLSRVDNESGDVRFPGNLVVEEGVQDRRRLWIGGDVHVKSTLDAHEVFVRGSLRVDGGIVGRGRALVRSGRGVLAKFVEHCNLETKGEVQLQSLAYNSRIFALQGVRISEGGALIGGEVRAGSHIDVPTVGNEVDVHAKLIVGVDFVMERKFQYARSKFQDLTLALQRLEAVDQSRRAPDDVTSHDVTTPNGASADGEAVDGAAGAENADGPDDTAQLENTESQKHIEQIREERGKYSVLMSDMLSYLDADEDAEIRITTAVYPGTEIQICRAHHTVTEPLGPSRFYLDKDRGRIAREDL